MNKVIMNWILVVLITFGLLLSCHSENATFTPTKNWQEIREGQSIPPGLHVRMNLQTGKKEAKLLDEGSNEEKQALSNSVQNSSETPANNDLNAGQSEPLGIEYSAERIEQIKRTYKSYEEIKKSFNEMKANFKTDAELISQILDEYKNITKFVEDNPISSIKTTDIVRVMENLSYLVHQIDNAIWFIDAGGLDEVILPIIVNQTIVSLRVQALRVLGALCQNNPKAQIKVFEKNFGNHIAQILITSTNADELSSALYAFGSLLRKFPHAQAEILSKSGTQALIGVIRKNCDLSIKAKAVTLISDLITEKALSLSMESDPENALAISQYKKVLLNEWLVANEYCESIDTALSKGLFELIEEPSVTEYFVQALISTHKICIDRWSQSSQLRHTLLTLKNRYNQSEEEYRIEVAQSIVKLAEMLYAQPQKRDEL